LSIPVVAPHLRRGEAGERAVAEYLTARGHRVVERNWRGRGGEIDLITLCNGVLHFIEVKTRSADGYGGGLEAITASKRAKLARTAEAYMLAPPVHDGCVFSVAVVSRAGDRYAVEFIPDAFDSPR